MSSKVKPCEHKVKSGQYLNKGRHGLLQIVLELITNRKCSQRGRWSSKGGVIVTIINLYKEKISCAVSYYVRIDICDGLLVKKTAS